MTDPANLTGPPDDRSARAVRVDREVTVAGAIGACTGAAALAGR